MLPTPDFGLTCAPDADRGEVQDGQGLEMPALLD